MRSRCITPPLVVSSLLLLVCSLTLTCTLAQLFPPVQHHVYFTGSHITSIALETDTGALFANDVVHGRVIRYNSSGGVSAVWSLTNNNNSLCSPTSLGLLAKKPRTGSRLLYVTDSTTGSIISVDPVTGEQDNSVTWTVPAAIWETGVVVVDVTELLHVDLYVIDRYRGGVTLLSPDGDNQVQEWLVQPSAAAPGINLYTSYLSAMTMSDEYHRYTVDGVRDRVLQTDIYRSITTRFALPDEVRGIQALSWTPCSDGDINDVLGCLWVLYQPAGETEQSVVAVSVQNRSVVHNWTVETAAADRQQQRTSADGGERQGQQASSNAHLVSPALHVVGQGTADDPFRVYMAEADPDGPGHVVVVRNESGQVVRRYDSMPQVVDSSGAVMHAFTSVQAEHSTCTLWLTDVDNGGMLVRAAPDGTILQNFSTPALFATAVLDLSDPSWPTLVLLSANASDWQLWRYYIANFTFEQIDTTAAHAQLDSSGCVGDGGCDTADAALVVGGMDVDSDSGRVLLSLTSAGKLLMLDGGGGWNETAWNTSSMLVRPGAVAFATAYLVVVIDYVSEQSGWWLKSFHGYTGTSFNNLSLASQPLVLAFDRGLALLWMSDVSGIITQIEPSLLIAQAYYQPMPAAYSMVSLSRRSDGTLFAVDRVTRRLIMLFVLPTGRTRPKSTGCHDYPVPPVRPIHPPLSSTSSSSSSSSSSAGGTGPTPPDTQYGLLSGPVMAVVAVVCGVVGVLLAALVYWQCRVRRRRWSGRQEHSRKRCCSSAWRRRASRAWTWGGSS